VIIEQYSEVRRLSESDSYYLKPPQCKLFITNSFQSFLILCPADILLTALFALCRLLFGIYNVRLVLRAFISGNNETQRI
jgi:hypothetical protein